MITLEDKWSKKQIAQLFEKPFMDLILQAQITHRKNFPANTIQIAKLLSIKTGACPEDCGYCSQSGHFNTGLEKQSLLPLEQVIAKAKQAKEEGATRFCLAAAWRSPPKKQLPQVLAMIREIKKLGLESCVTLGMLDEEDCQQLKEAGLDYYNHNLDTSPEYYPNIVTTRSYQQRLDTIKNVQQQNIKVCCGGILSLGETREDRVSFIHQLANLDPAPESVPINKLIAMKGTPFENFSKGEIDNFEFIKTIAVARITLEKSYLRLTAGRQQMSAEMQALCFFAGANSIFIGEKYITAENATSESNDYLFKALSLKAETFDAAEIS